MSGGVNSGSVYGIRGGRGYYSRGRGGRGEETKDLPKMYTCAIINKIVFLIISGGGGGGGEGGEKKKKERGIS